MMFDVTSMSLFFINCNTGMIFFFFFFFWQRVTTANIVVVWVLYKNLIRKIPFSDVLIFFFVLLLLLFFFFFFFFNIPS